MFVGFLFMTIECLRSAHSIVYRKIFRRYNKHDICKRQIMRVHLKSTPPLWVTWFSAFLRKLWWPGHQNVQFCRIYISFFIAQLRQLCQDMSEVIVRAQVIQFGCVWNAVDKGTRFGSSCCVMEHPVLFTDTESTDSPFRCRVIYGNITICLR